MIKLDSGLATAALALLRSAIVPGKGRRDQPGRASLHLPRSPRARGVFPWCRLASTRWPPAQG
jgi:hypothetical protein